MNQLALFGTIASYVALAVLLLSLNIFSLWRWWIKAAAIVGTSAVFVGAYFAITGMIGWPSDDALPDRFNLVYTRIVEPDKIHNTPGHVYLWVERVDEHQVILTAPRAYEVPYNVEVAKKTDQAQQMLMSGKKVLGKLTANSDQQVAHEGTPSPGGTTPQGNNAGIGKQQGTAQGGAGDTSPRNAASLTFSDMPPVDLPDKNVLANGIVLPGPDANGN